MRRILIATAMCAGVLAGPAASPAEALPHGCVSAARDFKVQFDPRTRSAGVSVSVDEPCTFIYHEGDTYSGSGRFRVTCESGGDFIHPDFQDGQYPPVALVPIPEPCEPGDVVTLDGYRAGTGGAVIGGSLTEATVPRLVSQDVGGAFHALCNPGTSPVATVSMQAPLNYSGLLRYSGRVNCAGANVKIRSVTASPYLGYPNPSAGSAACKRCTREISVAGEVPAELWMFEVEMKFEVRRYGQVVRGTRLGRYLATWAGEGGMVCPVGDGESCAA